MHITYVKFFLNAKEINVAVLENTSVTTYDFCEFLFDITQCSAGQDTKWNFQKKGNIIGIHLVGKYVWYPDQSLYQTEIGSMLIYSKKIVIYILYSSAEAVGQSNMTTKLRLYTSADSWGWCKAQ